MSKICQVTGKKAMFGNNVSFAKNTTKRRFNLNLHKHKFWVESEKKFVSLTVSVKGMRIIDKVGIDKVLKDIKERGK
jgi:large subunit ribosomal protein L28